MAAIVEARAMSDEKIYTGSCHCGAVAFEVTMAPPKKATSCNCSICGRAGWLLAFVPAAQLKVLRGEDALTDYQFGKKSIHHTFCKTCGVRPFSRGAGKDGKAWSAVNLRCVEGIDTAALAIESFDGKAL
jgi:hypothetical protein